MPSRLIGVMVDVRLYTDHVEVYYKGHLAESMERIRGKDKARIDYRHIIGSLVRKPGAFARYRFREQMYPSHTSGWRTTRCVAGRESVRTWTMCGYCTLPLRLWSAKSRGRSRDCSHRACGSTTRW